ncbi:MAG: protein-L-isoaspartate O-methyltransferase [Candidatus Saccharibacteria bacterium]|nr:protein-L-isoaspartate O-methyltransferase [Candidatus Saccharibacteria bacterium]
MVSVVADPVQEIETVARPWDKTEDTDALLNRIGEAHYVLLGEASHGTSEFYAWRSRISQRLIAEKGFSFIAVEGDWPDCYQVNRYVKQYPHSGNSATEVLSRYKRWPTWMWANKEIVRLAEWLHAFNASRPLEDRVGFYGLDVYSLWDSLDAVVKYLEKTDPEAAEQAKQAYRCFEPYGHDPQLYAYHTAFAPKSCEEEVIRVLRLIQEKFPAYADDFEADLDAEQNARTVMNAEHYYRTMVRGDAASWNIRDNHMVETLGNLMKRYGPEAKAIIWAHNTHVGDARYTDMADHGMVNIGQLVREAQTEDDTVLVGFSTYEGTVVAGAQWDAPMRIIEVPPGQSGSWEALLHEAMPHNKLIMSYEVLEYEGFWEARDHRAIGVVYDPRRESLGNYVPTLLPRRYDALIHIDRTRALHPLHIEPQHDRDLPETFPWTT